MNRFPLTTPRLSLVLTMILATALGACSSVKLEDPPPAPVESRNNAAPAGETPWSGQARPTTQASGSVAGLDPLNDPGSQLSKRSIFFEYDGFSIRDEYRRVLEAHARYLQANRQRTIVIEGNTDERGGREYNLALGQKRAEAVRKALSLLGVQDSQMEAISLGEEKPRAMGVDEASYAENRRADIVYR